MIETLADPSVRAGVSVIHKVPDLNALNSVIGDRSIMTMATQAISARFRIGSGANLSVWPTDHHAQSSTPRACAELDDGPSHEAPACPRWPDARSKPGCSQACEATHDCL